MTPITTAPATIAILIQRPRILRFCVFTAVSSLMSAEKCEPQGESKNCCQARVHQYRESNLDTRLQQCSTYDGEQNADCKTNQPGREKRTQDIKRRSSATAGKH